MSAKANPTTVGLFVVIGLGLGLAALVTLNSNRLFTRTRDCILYFDTSLNGLSEGSPVKFRGVTIGSVKKLMINFDQATNDYAMPVIIEIRENLLRDRVGNAMTLDTARDIQANVQRGLRGTLAAESLVTGVLYIDLDAIPWAAPPTYHQLGKTYPEIPTRPTQIQQLLMNLAQVDIKGIEERLNKLLDAIDTTARDFRAAEISTSVTNLLASLNALLHLQDVTNAVAGVSVTLERYRALADTLERRVTPVADGVTNSLAQLDETLAQVRAALGGLQGLLGPNTATRQELSLALSQIANAAQSLENLAEYLHQNPNAILTGRKSKENKP